LVHVVSRGTKIHPLRAWRAEHGYTQDEVADLSNRSPAFISLIESGQRNPRPQTKVAIARALGARVRDLFPPAQLPPSDDAGE
jgi:transcriptional regulator with XRE-family HTH domain